MKHKKNSSLSLGFLVLNLCCVMTSANAQTPQQIAQKAFASTVLLVMEDANGQPLGLGSGFFVKPNQVATNLHVVEGAARGYAKLIGQRTKRDIEGITAIDARRDLVMLRVSALGVPAVTLGDSDTVLVGETVYAVGNPHGLEGTFSQGIISSVRTVGTDKVLQLTAPISPGSSGGPVLNGQGKVIGVSVATFREGQNLNFAVPSNYLATLMAQISEPKPLSRAAQTKSRPSIVAGLGGKSVQGVIGDRLTWTYGTMQIGEYSFSLRNRLRENVRNVYCFVIFYDEQADPIDVDVVHLSDQIPAGLAKRVISEVDTSVQKLTTRVESMAPHTKVEIRVLDFEIVE
ncbi:MAG: S1C family serine protease [Candidatus Poribacteria bacterium]|nr:S1C family serine protease [Candidatus Poribacteria bacterium]MDE0506545.1 S1C family serine protease [Candidatus Poribacteria bacterium]